MKIEVKTELSTPIKDLSQAKKKIIYIVSKQVRKDSNYFIPKREGDLEDSSFVHSNLENGHIEWNTPYARRLYWNPQYNFRKDKNPNARGKWFEHAKKEHLSEWLNIAYKRWNE